MTEGKYHIFEENGIIIKNEEKRNDAIVLINLYYVDDIEFYINRVFNICDYIQVVMITSNPEVFSILQELCRDYKNIQVRMKNNRGRDVSALLVTCRDLLLQYKYICFIHDKKSKKTYIEQEVIRWAQSLCVDMIASKYYVQQILDIFDKDSNLGLVIPPLPYGYYQYVDTWTVNFDNTVNLAKKIGICTELLKQDIPPIALGTVFWCRAEALKKLFRISWKYEDFPQEPLNHDGTISHAIERILPYVAQDAGYRVDVVELRDNAEKRLLFHSNNEYKVFQIMKRQLGIELYEQVENFESHKEEMTRLFTKCDEVFIYGAGIWGNNCKKMCDALFFKPKGFVVSKKTNQTELDGIPILEFNSLKRTEKTGFVIAVGYMTIDVIRQYLLENHVAIDNIIVFL